jgi:hypothetical protein
VGTHKHLCDDPRRLLTGRLQIEKTTAELAPAAEAGGPFLSFCPSRASLISEFLSTLSLCFPAVPSNQKKTDVLFMTKRESAT